MLNQLGLNYLLSKQLTQSQNTGAPFEIINYIIILIAFFMQPVVAVVVTGTFLLTMIPFAK